METGITQRRNAQQRSGLDDAFLRNKTFFEDGARLSSAVLATHREGGGKLMYGWMADSPQNYGAGATTLWTETNINIADYLATANGGPYVDFSASPTSRLHILDAAWQEAGTEELFVWCWAKMSSSVGVIGTEVVISKYDTNANNRSWILYLTKGVAPSLNFQTDQTGAAVVVSTVASSISISADTWYFIAAYFEASTQLRIYTGLATDAVLTTDTRLVGVTASVFNGTAPLALGTAYNGAPGTTLYPWQGAIGISGSRFNTPTTSIDGYASRLFQMSKWFYQ